MPLVNPQSSSSTDTSQIESRLGEVSATPTAHSLNDRLLQVLSRFGASGDANSATGSLIARIGAFAANIGTIVTNFGAIADANSATGSLIARIGAFAANIGTIVTNFGAIADANSATGSLIARIGAFAANIATIVTNFGAIGDASSVTGSLMARIRAFATDIASVVAATTHPSAATRISYTFAANTAQNIAAAASAGVRWRTVSVRSPSTNSASLFICLGSAPATTADATVELQPGGFYESYHVGVISAISSGTPTVTVTTQQ